MRGKGIQPRYHRVAMGITPAYAGKSLTIPNLTTRSWDHPRVCGEKRFINSKEKFMLGSPPRMRGKVRAMAGHGDGEGITPAYAGKSMRFSKVLSSNKDHPRVCGEKGFAHCTPALHIGSPPRMRGKVFRAGLHDSLIGITPAYAGKRRPDCQHHRKPRDHPRVCGEKISVARIQPCTAGSPPRMRGKGF